MPFFAKIGSAMGSKSVLLHSGHLGKFILSKMMTSPEAISKRHRE